MRKFLFLLVISYFLALIEKTFFAYFTIRGIAPDLVLGLVYLYYFLTSKRENITVYLAFFAGFILDVFSSLPFGVWTTSLLVSVLVLSVLNSHFDKTNPFFIPISFFIFLGVYKVSSVMLTLFFSLFNLSSVALPFYFSLLGFIVEYIYSFVFLFICSLIIKKYVRRKIFL
ncbi:hypothetical protein J7J81_00255 [bacterium]|nr:hypothetical protein [bacterium]